jgi:hypothetical protein
MKDKKLKETPVEDELKDCTFLPETKNYTIRREKYSTYIEGDKCQDLYERGL